MTMSPVLFIGLLCFASGGSLLPAVEAIWFNVPNTGERCVSEEIQANVVVVADYMCVEQDNYTFGYTLDVRVLSPPSGKELYKNTNVTYGQFAFTSSEPGEYLLCVSMHHDQSHHTLNGSAIVNIDWKMGIQTKDWDSIAKKEKIEGVELQLKKSTELAGALKANQIYMKYREAYLRGMNEKTNERVQHLTAVSILVCTAVSILQVCYLKRYFRKKKFI